MTVQKLRSALNRLAVTAILGLIVLFVVSTDYFIVPFPTLFSLVIISSIWLQQELVVLSIRWIHHVVAWSSTVRLQSHPSPSGLWVDSAALTRICKRSQPYHYRRMNTLRQVTNWRWRP